MTDRDIAHPRQNPHINFETYRTPIGPGLRGGDPASNIHIYLPRGARVASLEGEATVQSVVTVLRYDGLRGVVTHWDEGTVLRAEIDQSLEPTVILSGNRTGLVSLARHLLTLAQEDVPVGSHLDFDSYCGWLEDGSAAIRIELE